MLKTIIRALQNRKILIEPLEKFDALILHGIEKDLLLACLPPNSKTKVCPAEKEIPVFLSVFWFLDVLKGIFSGMGPGPAFFRAAIKIWDPRVVLSYETIFSLPGEVAGYFPDKKFIVLSRCMLVPPQLPRKLPIFYSFGNYDKEVLDQEGIEYTEHRAIGSLKAEVVRKEFGHREKRYDLCLISQYREVIVEHNLAAAPAGYEQLFEDMFNAYNKACSMAFSYLCRFTKSRNLTLCVAMSSPYTDLRLQKKERNYFNSLFNEELSPVFLPRMNQSGYEAVLSSRVSITIDSALGYETLGLWEKILFFVPSPSVQDFYRKVFRCDDPPIYSRLPNELKITGTTYEEFAEKLERLMGMEEGKYRNLIEDACYCYMNNRDSPPDEFLKRTLQAIIQEPVERIKTSGTENLR